MKSQTSSTHVPAVTPPPVRNTEFTAYENNPFMVPIDGIRMLFSRAQAIAIIMIAIAALGFIANIVSTIVQAIADNADKSSSSPSGPMSTNEEISRHIASIPPETWVIIAIIAVLVVAFLLVGWLVGVYIQSVIDYTSARVAKGHDVSLGDALRGGISRFGAYIWLQIIIATKVILWSLLFIIPGIIMAVRYSLAGLSFYDKNLSARAAVKDSLALTKGAWLTTFASSVLLDFISLGIASTLVKSGAQVRLYGQLDAVTQRGEAKPAAHILSWLTIGGIIACFILGLLLIALVALIITTVAVK